MGFHKCINDNFLGTCVLRLSPEGISLEKQRCHMTFYPMCAMNLLPAPSLIFLSTSFTVTPMNPLCRTGHTSVERIYCTISSFIKRPARLIKALE